MHFSKIATVLVLIGLSVAIPVPDESLEYRHVHPATNAAAVDKRGVINAKAVTNAADADGRAGKFPNSQLILYFG
jgi:hypothetical protein